MCIRDSINVALHVAAQLKAGVVWVNCTNLFDASCGFGGYRESGYGREGGREGLLEYLQPSWFNNAARLPAVPTPVVPRFDQEPEAGTPAIDRTVKLYICLLYTSADTSPDSFLLRIGGNGLVANG